MNQQNVCQSKKTLQNDLSMFIMFTQYVRIDLAHDELMPIAHSLTRTLFTKCEERENDSNANNKNQLNR